MCVREKQREKETERDRENGTGECLTEIRLSAVTYH